MKTILALALAAATIVPGPLAAAAAQPGYFAAPRADQFRAGRYVVTVFEGSPPRGEANGRNSFSRGIRVFERPRGSTFAAVAAQEIFEIDFKAGAGPAARLHRGRMELISHEIESLVASRYGGFNLAAFEAKEARAMTQYPHLRGMTVEQILAGMRASRPIAEQWLRDNRDVIQALVAYRFPR